MRPARIEGATAAPGAPANWDEAASGPCVALPIREEVVDGTIWLVSRWEPSPEDQANVAAGGFVELRLSARQHPVVSLATVPPPPLTGG